MKNHELNENFEWKDLSGPFRFISESQADQYNREGFVVLENVFSEHVIDELLESVDPIEEAATEQLRKFKNGRFIVSRADEITFSPGIVSKSKIADRFVRSQPFLDLTYDFLGPDVRLYVEQLVYKKPGNPRHFPWHQDNGYTFIEPQHYLTCWVSLTDATEANGCPWVIPGVHRQGTLAHVWTDLGFSCVSDEPADAVAAPVGKGGIVVFSSLTPHMTGPNLTDETRKAYIVQFAPDGAVNVRIEKGERVLTRCNTPHSQFQILKGGLPVTAQS